MRGEKKAEIDKTKEMKNTNCFCSMFHMLVNVCVRSRQRPENKTCICSC